MSRPLTQQDIDQYPTTLKLKCCQYTTKSNNDGEWCNGNLTKIEYNKWQCDTCKKIFDDRTMYYIYIE